VYRKDSRGGARGQVAVGRSRVEGELIKGGGGGDKRKANAASTHQNG